MKKYYIGIAVLLVLCVGAVGYALSQAAAAKQDKVTDQVVEQFTTQMDTYIANHGDTPQSLSQLGIKDAPSTVSYQALSGSKYKICFNYHAAASGFDAGWTSLLSGGITGNTQAPISGYGGSGYFDSSVEFNHKKGQNCQTVTPSYVDTLNSGGSSTYLGNTPKQSGCYNFTAIDYITGNASVSSVDTTTQQINFNTNDEYLYDKNGKTLTPLASAKYDSSTTFCDSNYKQTSVSDIKAGSMLDFYLTSAANPHIIQANSFDLNTSN